MDNSPTKAKIFKQALKIAAVSVGLAFFVITPASAQGDPSSAVGFDVPAGSTAIEIKSMQLAAGQKKGIWQSFKDNLKKFTWDKVLSELKKAGDVAWKAALKNFLNNLAYDTATYLATGDKGQMPMFETQGWGGYLKSAADNAAGTFIEELGKGGAFKFNLCNPNFNVLLRINLGLLQSVRPKAPACTFSQLTKNWDAALKDKNFLPKFQDMFNPWSNDLGIALTLQTGMTQNITDKTLTAAKDREEGQGFKPLTDAISKNIKTPGQLIKEQAGIPLKTAPSGPLAYTGSVIADSIDIFVNTLAGKLIEKWMRGGLVTNFPPLANKLDTLTNPNAQNLAEGAAGAANRMKSIVEPNFKVRADYDILAELTTCPDPNKAGPTNCVIDEKFRQAIENKMTVGQALNQGYLNGNGIFGFTSDGLEPKFNEGYPYRSMIILRKYRIIPVGWEAAGQKLKDQQSLISGTKNLKNLVDCFSDAAAAQLWCFGLVDPDWVLKAPQNFCKREGAGPEIISEQVTGQGADSSLAILRNDAYCADEQSCIKEKTDGSCQLYGYCAAERRKWDFNANACLPLYNTCQTFGTEAGQTISYLENTLDFGVCNAGNAGCKKYAIAALNSYDAVAKNVNWQSSTQAVYLNKQAESCDEESQGCHGLVRVFPEKNKTYDDIFNGGVAKAYASSTSLIYEKLLPDYLQNACYAENADGYVLKNDAPAQCANFARQCKKDEAGCELYTSVASEIKIPAKVALNDYCPLACVGYNSFVQSATVFDSSRDGYFIPKTAKTCGAEAAGCDQFTNLDEVKKGGEGLEYYSYLRQCLKASDNANSCAEFYNWEGSDESGYQLKVESLKLDNDTNDARLPAWAQYVGDPAVSSDDSGNCSETIYNLPPSDPAYNADCRQFYNRAGGISYHLYSRTIACSDDCHPYRRTELNVDENITASASCGSNCTAAGAEGAAECWDTGSSQCVSCKGGGTWSVSNNACIYMAVPGQGVTCSAQANGCREYTGNTGNNVRQIFTDDFSAGVGAWSGVNGSTVAPSSQAITLGPDNKGHSLLVTVANSPDAVKRQVGSSVSQGLDYVINFVAKAEKDTDLTFSLVNASGQRAIFAKVSLTRNWQILSTNLTGLSHEATSSEIMLASADENFYINNISLTEITDRYYLIKNSWRTPDSCDEDLDGRPSPLYMLGCDQYKDRADKTHNLKQFNKLCPESAVGCELMIDTKNSSATSTSYYKDGQVGTAADHDLTVPADDFIYAVYDPEKLCGADEKGCELLGQQYKYENTTLYGDIYLKNNPDQYKTILCGANAVGCEAFAYDNGAADNGEKYFKDPGDQVCEYRQQRSGTGQSYGWYKKKVKRCLPTGQAGGGNTGAVCLSKADCSSGATCQLETDDKLCPTGHCADASKKVCATDSDCSGSVKCQEDFKTLGLGGVGSQVSQPAGNGWAGICQAADSGCSEYIDPLSRFNTNIIFNGSFQVLATNSTDGWENGVTCTVGSFCQSITLEPNTVYRLARADRAGRLTIRDCPSGSQLYEINDSNALVAKTSITADVPSPDRANSQIFYYKAIASGSCTIEADYDSANRAGAVELKPVAIDYQLRANLDKQTCNGLVNSGQGCVLFNERKQDGSGLAALNWDADTANGGQPAGGHCSLTGDACSVDLDCTGAGNTCQGKDSNIILKVAPDRVCDKWLACKSYIKDARGDNVCFDIGLCDAVNENGNCQSFITSSKTNQVAETLGADSISNLSGYAKVGITGGTLKTDYYPFGAMEQYGEVANFSNGGFEYYGSNLYPIGWTWGNQANQSWNANVFSVISNPIAAQTEGVGYAPEGKAFLKMGSSYTAVSEQIDVIPGVDYTITAYLNTKNLKSGSSSIDILGSDICRKGECKNLGNLCTSDNDCPMASVITQSLGNDWNFQMGKFNTGANSQIRIKLYSSAGGAAGSEGNFYYDDIKIRPALNSRIKAGDCWPGYCISNNIGNVDNGHCSNNVSTRCLVSNDVFWYTPQTCRLYPQSDSLACDYYEESGKRQKGWPGYCLEYDRRPGDPNTCLLWYPIDKVKGDGIEEGAGYADRIPLYYTVGMAAKFNCSTDMLVPVEIGKEIKLHGCCQNSDNRCDNPPSQTLTSGAGTASVYESNLPLYGLSGVCAGGGQCFDYTITYTQGGGSAARPAFSDGRYDYYCPDSTIPEVIHAVGYCNGAANFIPAERKQFSQYYASKIVQVVTPMGNNKYWASRVYKGSDYNYSCNASLPNQALTSLVTTSPGYASALLNARNCNYGSDYAPFGAADPPAPSSNPYEWDSSTQESGIQPLSYELDKNVARAGQEQTINDVKRLFAQSYGVWNWNGTSANGKYEAAQNLDWGPPGANGEGLAENYGKCFYTTRPANSLDYCAIPPSVSNVKVNSAITDVNIVKNGFINLTFNTKVDSNQLPMVMYGVDWGDGSNTMVTGVEMRDKPNPDQPESVYHLYSYWDLKAKANSGVVSITRAPIICRTGDDDIGYCQVKPVIQIKDNWGWCNKGTAINTCGVGQWDSFGGWVVVKEK